MVVEKTIIMAYTLPVGSAMSMISVCQQSNSIMVCQNYGVITVWQYLIQGTNVYWYTEYYIDALLEKYPTCILKIHTSWVITCIAIHKNFLGYASQTDVRVVKMKQKRKDKHSNDPVGYCEPYGVTSVTVDKRQFVEVRFSTETNDLVPSTATKPNSYPNKAAAAAA